jgi:hypothetical protein
MVYFAPAQDPTPWRAPVLVSAASGQPISFCSSIGSERIARSVWKRARAALNSVASRPMDDRIDISFSFGCGASRMNAFGRLDIPHRVQFRVRSVGAMARPAFDGVDYPPILMFNQTKWNDASHQKN